LRRTLKIPGISAAVVKDQKLLWVKRLGSADVENTTPATPETNYRIASLIKPFASTLLMQLVERGKLDLDEPMAKYSRSSGSASAAGRSRCATC
jgi:CubicO group peptidase (beta-lactamase class C family)